MRKTIISVFLVLGLFASDLFAQPVADSTAVVKSDSIQANAILTDSIVTVAPTDSAAVVPMPKESVTAAPIETSQAAETLPTEEASKSLVAEQEAPKKASSKSGNSIFFQHWGFGLGVNTYGFNASINTRIVPHLDARLGFNYLTLKYDEAVDFTADNAKPGPTFGAEMHGSLSNFDLKFPNGSLLLDFYPWKNGFFSITGGIYFGKNKITADGHIDNYQEGDYFEVIDGVYIQPDKYGDFNARIRLGSAVKPYFGIGLGKTMPKHRVSFKYDLGVIYQGKITVESDNEMTQGSAQSLLDNSIDFNFNEEILKLWPMMSFAISIRLF